MRGVSRRGEIHYQFWIETRSMNFQPAGFRKPGTETGWLIQVPQRSVPSFFFPPFWDSYFSQPLSDPDFINLNCRNCVNSSLGLPWSGRCKSQLEPEVTPPLLGHTIPLYRWRPWCLPSKRCLGRQSDGPRCRELFEFFIPTQPTGKYMLHRRLTHPDIWFPVGVQSLALFTQDECSLRMISASFVLSSRTRWY